MLLPYEKLRPPDVNAQAIINVERPQDEHVESVTKMQPTQDYVSMTNDTNETKTSKKRLRKFKPPGEVYTRSSFRGKVPPGPTAEKAHHLHILLRGKVGWDFLIL